MKNKLKSILLACVILLTPCLTLAQSGSTDNVTVNVESVSIRSVVKMLFKDSNNSYSINGDVDGEVTASLKNVSFEKALKTLLDQVNCTFIIKDKVFYIMKKSNDNIVSKSSEQLYTKSENSIRRIKIRHADPQLIFLLLAGLTNPGTPPEMSSIDGIRRGN